MIEPTHAARLGITAAFTAGDTTRVEQATARLRSLGITHLRVALDDSHPASWHEFLLATLGESCEILIALPRVEVSDLKELLRQAGTACDAVEIPADASNAVELGYAVQQSGQIAVLGIPANTNATWLRRLGESGALKSFDAIGLQHGTADALSWRNAMQQAAHCYKSDLRIWITNIGHPASPHDETAQARAFLNAVDLPVERIFWRSLAETGDGTGLDDEDGQPRLLARLLAGGVDAVARHLTNPAPAPLPKSPVLVTDGAGFIGANLADKLAADGNDVLIYDALSRPGVERNLTWLKQRHPGRIAVAINDLRDEAALTEATRGAAAVFHLAAQVAVTTSLVRPVQDFDINVRGTLTVLEALRRFNAEAPIIFASTNKVYGDLADISLIRRGDQYLPEDADLRARGIDESRPLCFHTPYGCSKGAADQYVLDYAHSFGLRTAVLRMSCIYGERQFGTEDQGWLAHFLLRAIAGDAITIYGDGRQVRDVLHIDDAVETYIGAWQHIDQIAGQAFNLGGGPANAISLKQLIDHIEHILGRGIDLSFEDWRAGDQRYFVADATTVRSTLGLRAPLGWRDGVARLAAHFGAKQDATQLTEDAL